MQKANRRGNPRSLWGLAEFPRISPRPPRLRVSVPEHLSRGAAEDAESGFVFLGGLDSEGESAKKTLFSKLHHFSSLVARRGWSTLARGKLQFVGGVAGGSDRVGRGAGQANPRLGDRTNPGGLRPQAPWDRRTPVRLHSGPLKVSPQTADFRAYTGLASLPGPEAGDAHRHSPTNCVQWAHNRSCLMSPDPI
jgi:hypothetical protein